MRLALFDLDGTLIDSRADLAAAVNAMRARHGLSALPLIADGKYLQYIISWLTGCAAAFVLTYIVGKVRGYDKETV